MIRRLLLAVAVGVSAPAAASTELKPETPFSEAVKRFREKPVQDTTRTVPAPVVKPIPAAELLGYRRRPVHSAFEWHPELDAFLDRRR